MNGSVADESAGAPRLGGGRRVRLSLDLACLAGYALAVPTALTVLELAAVVRLLLGVPLVAFTPGYALVAVALPADRHGDPGNLDALERVVVAVGASVALVVLGSLALAAVYTGGLDTVPYRAVLGAATAALAVVAWGRRRRRPPGDRAGVADPRWLLRSDRSPGLVDLVLIVAVLFAVGTLGYAVAAPPAPTADTSVTLLTETEDGEYVAGGYPDEVVAGTPATVTVGIENDASVERRYTVVAVLERLGPEGERTLQRRALARESVTVAAGATVRRPVTVRPELLGDRLRISYYVYRGDPGADPAPGSADRHLYVWVSVVPDGGSG